MRPLRTFLLAIALAAGAATASAHPGDVGVTTEAARSNVVEASVVVSGTVAVLKADLYGLERWPAVFSDVRSLQRNPDGTWAIDFRRFGHAHDFRFTRTPTGVVFELAARDHGSARMEYVLEPIDATRSKLTIRLDVSTPPQLSVEQFLTMLRAKAYADLADFSFRVPAAR